MTTAAPQTPATPTAQAPTQVRTLSRDDVLTMGRSSPPWTFLPVAQAALRQAPGDHALRLLAAAACARLSLRTPASEHLNHIPPELLADPGLAGLVQVVARLPEDRISKSELLATCRANTEALGDRAPGLRAALSAFEPTLEHLTVCRALDGQVILRASPGADWDLLADHLAAARQLVARLTPADSERPLYLEGLSPPWVALELLTARPVRPDGYAPRTVLVQADPAEALLGLCLADLTALLSAPGVTLLTGADATLRLRLELATRADFGISGPAMVLSSVRRRCEPALAGVIAAAEAGQQRTTESLHAGMMSLYAGRTPAWWAARFDRARAGGEPLRVLLPTCRFSTFVKHSASDLAAALGRSGCDARVLIEPDASTKLATPAFLRQFVDFRPDLVIFLNYPRKMFADALPKEVPFVCWIQDAMPHLFDRALGESQGPLDFVVGYTFEELFTRHHYPRERAMPFHLAADDAKFHPAPVPRQARFEADIAYVSHQGETPDAQHARLRAMFAEKLGVRRALDDLRPIIERETLKPLSDLHHEVIFDAAAAALRAELGRDPEPRLLEAVYKSYCQPHADRLLRHQTLEWAAEACRQNGWRLRLFGQGWASHPTLAPFASGDVSHGDDLRACYQQAAVHLHVAGQSLVHQRIMECALSGGVPLCRIHAPERWGLLVWLLHQTRSEGATKVLDLSGPGFPRGGEAYRRRSTPALIRAEELFAGLGLADAVLPSPPGRPDLVTFDFSIVNNPGLASVPIDQWSAYWALGQQPELFFHDAPSLAARVRYVLNNPSRRRALNEVAAASVRSHYTYSLVASKILDLVRHGLTPLA